MDSEQSVKEKLSHLLQKKKIIQERENREHSSLQFPVDINTSFVKQELPDYNEQQQGIISESHSQSAVSISNNAIEEDSDIQTQDGNAVDNEPVDPFSNISLHAILNQKKLALLRNKDVLELLKQRHK